MFSGKYIILPLLLLLVTSCWNEEFSKSQEDKLSFSSEAVRFDTLFTEVTSAVRWLVIKNNNSKPLQIENLYLEKGNQGFQLNVDGANSGTINRFTQVPVWAHDSIFILVGARPKVLAEGDDPIYYEDRIVFEINGMKQTVALSASSWNADKWIGKSIESETVVSQRKPILVYDSLVIKPGATLTLEGGVKLFFHKNAILSVEGTLITNGSSSQPVSMQGDRLDNLLTDIPYNRAAGQWGGIRFKRSSHNNRLSHLVVKGMDWGIKIDSADIGVMKLEMENCVVRNANGTLFQATNATTQLNGCELSNGGDGTVLLSGGEHHWTHCTIASYAPWGGSGMKSLVLENQRSDPDGKKVNMPLTATFDNCIVGGRSSNELQLNNLSETTFDVSFSECLIRGEYRNGATFNNHLWWLANGQNNPNFKTIELSKYLFDFKLKNNSAALEKGEPKANNLTDFYGVVRTKQSGKVDLGAYVIIPE